MIKFTQVLTILLLTMFASSVSAKLDVQVRFSKVANMVYHLDCITGMTTRCSRQAYQDLWQRRFLNTKDDRLMVEQWKELSSRYAKQFEFEDTERNVSVAITDILSIPAKLRIASFQSDNWSEYFTKLDLIVVPKDRLKFEKVIRRFEARFDKWWEDTAYSKGSSFAVETSMLLKTKDLSKKIDDYYKFYEVNLPDPYTLSFNLIYRPEEKGAAHGQQIENYSVAEFLPKESPNDRIDVVIHELCHFFYANTKSENLIALRDAFNKIDSPAARGSYNLLNESLATALGNGLISKLLMDSKKWKAMSEEPRSFYNDKNIDRAAKAIMPWLEEHIASGKSLYDSKFVGKYFSLLSETFEAELSAPRLLLNEMVLVADGDFGIRFKDLVKSTISPSSIYSSEGEWSDPRFLNSYKRNSGLNAVIIVHSKNLEQLKKQHVVSELEFKNIQQQLRDKTNLLYSYRRSGNAVGFLVIAQDQSEASKLIEKLSFQTSGFKGIL